MRASGNLFADIPAQLVQEAITTLASSPALRIERIVSRGQASPPGFWYDQPQDEWVIVLAGCAELAFADDGATMRMAPGDYVRIPAHRRHRVTWTDPAQATVWLAVHYGPGMLDRDRGASHDSSPPTPPDIRVRIRRFGDYAIDRPATEDR
ncbi:MAG TPA: cupin domain-containing protein, partial [Xanthobacteraceae bacterium]